MCTAYRAEQRQWTKPLTESAVQATPSTLRRSADIRRLNHRFRATFHRKAAPQRCITTKALIPSRSMRMAVRVRRRVSPRSTLPMQPCQLQRLLAQDTPSRAGERVLPLPMQHISRDQHSIRMQTRHCMQSGQPRLIPSVIMPTADRAVPVLRRKHTASKCSSQGLSRQEAVIPFSDGAPRPQRQVHRISRANGIMQMPILPFAPYGRKTHLQPIRCRMTQTAEAVRLAVRPKPKMSR